MGGSDAQTSDQHADDGRCEDCDSPHLRLRSFSCRSFASVGTLALVGAWNQLQARSGPGRLRLFGTGAPAEPLQTPRSEAASGVRLPIRRPPSVDSSAVTLVGVEAAGAVTRATFAAAITSWRRSPVVRPWLGALGALRTGERHGPGALWTGEQPGPGAPRRQSGVAGCSAGCCPWGAARHPCAPRCSRARVPRRNQKQCVTAACEPSARSRLEADPTYGGRSTRLR